MQELDLVEAARSGDEAAWRHLCAKYSPGLLGRARRYTGNAEDAQEVLQEALARAFESIGTLAEPASFGGWLHRILFRCAISRQRRERAGVRGAGVTHVSIDAEGQQLPDPDALHFESLLVETVVGEMQKLLGEERASLFLLSRVWGYPMLEIAAGMYRMPLSDDTRAFLENKAEMLYKWVQRDRVKLQKHLRKKYGDELDAFT